MTYGVDLRERRIEDWLLSIMRFAITRRPEDRAAAAVSAERLDSLGGTQQKLAFFSRTTDSVCAAIEAPDSRRSEAVLKAHLHRIDNRRLRNAYEGALRCENPSRQLAVERKPPSRRSALWTGLPEGRYGVPRQK